MATIDDCRLLCASASAYLIETSFPVGTYQKDLRPVPNGSNQNTIRQYNAIQLLSDPFVVVASPLQHNPSITIEACFVGETSEGIVISFRGTLPPFPLTADSLADWIEDIFYADTVPYFPHTSGKVHNGFLDALLTLESGITTALNALDPHRNKPIYLTGHSKGGGMAPIAAMYFKAKNTFQTHHIVTFAGPKPGDANFRDAFNSAFPKYTNYENYWDIVPFMAPGKVFIELLEKFPLLPQVIKDLLNKAAQWNYEPVGSNNVQYIDSTGTVDNNPLYANPLVRFGEILAELTHGKEGLIQIGNAHHISCGFRYMKGTCKGQVCQF